MKIFKKITCLHNNITFQQVLRQKQNKMTESHLKRLASYAENLPKNSYSLIWCIFE